LLQARGDSAKASEYLDRAAQAGPQDRSNLKIEAQLRAQGGDPTRAIRLLEDTTNLGVDEDLLLGALYRQQNDFERAEVICKKLMKKPDLRVIAFAVDLYGAMGRGDDVRRAIAVVRELPNVEPGAAELLLADYAARYGNPEEAVQQSRLATQRAPQNVTSWRALTVSCLLLGKTGDAATAVEEGLKILPANPYLIAMADARPLLSLGAADARLGTLVIAFARDPEAPGAKEALQVMAVPTTNEPSSARLDRLKQVTAKYPRNLTLQLFTCRLLLQEKQVEEGVKLATAGAENFPLSLEAARQAASALMTKGDWARAEEFAGTWRSRTPNTPLEADFLAADAMLKQNKASASKDRLAAYFPKALERPKDNAPLIALYAVALLRSNAVADAERILLPALQGDEAVRTAWLARASEDLAPSDAGTWAARVSGMEGDSSWVGQMQLAQIMSSIGQKSPTEAILVVNRRLRSQIVERKDIPPQQLALTFATLASLAEQDKELGEAEALYRRALAVDGSLAVVKNNLAMVLVSEGRNLDEAASLVNEAIRVDPPRRPNYYDTLAHVLTQRGDFKNAVEAIQKAADLDSNNLLWQVRLIELLSGAQRGEDASKALAKLEAVIKIKGKLDDEGLQSRIDKLRQKAN
jgi:tetratricopeptide (TPR) repeat protein